eukprot:9370809-Pyramimonas_sp.AAC.1
MGDGPKVEECFGDPRRRVHACRQQSFSQWMEAHAARMERPIGWKWHHRHGLARTLSADGGAAGARAQSYYYYG